MIDKPKEYPLFDPTISFLSAGEHSNKNDSSFRIKRLNKDRDYHIRQNAHLSMNKVRSAGHSPQGSPSNHINFSF